MQMKKKKKNQHALMKTVSINEPLILQSVGKSANKSSITTI